MGESRGGEGSGNEVTTTVIARYLIQERETDGREIDQLRVEFLTSGLYAIEISYRGEPEPERFFFGVDE